MDIRKDIEEATKDKGDSNSMTAAEQSELHHKLDDCENVLRAAHTIYDQMDKMGVLDIEEAKSLKIHNIPHANALVKFLLDIKQDRNLLILIKRIEQER